MKNPKVSFVIPTHNCVAWLPHAVKSIEEQKYNNLQIVIVNDGSTDSTAEYLKWLEKNKKIDTVIVNGLFGRSKARNVGNLAATGEIICVLDADDIASPERAAKTVDKVLSGAEFVYGSADVMDFSGRKFNHIQADVFNLNKALENKENRIVHSTVAYTKKMAIKFPYSEDKEVSDNGLDDWEQQLRMASNGVKFDFITGTIAAYRILNNAISQRRDSKVVEKVKDKYLQKYMVTA